MRLKVGLASVTLSGLTLAIAACGGSGGASATNSQAAANGAGGALQAYTACLSQHGVTLPSTAPRVRRSDRPSTDPTDRPSGRPSRVPGGGGGGFGSVAPSGVDQGAWDKAQQACASLRPSGGPGGGFGGRDNGAMTAYRTCLTDHGVTLPAGGNNQLNQLNTADPKTADAIKACEPLRPTAQPGRQPNPSST